MTSHSYTFFPDLAAEETVPERGIHSQTLSRGGSVEVVMFGLAAGEELSEHTSSRPAIIHVLRGQGELSVAGDTHPAAPGTWLRMEAGARHAVVAGTDLVFALYLLPGEA